MSTLYKPSVVSTQETVVVSQTVPGAGGWRYTGAPLIKGQLPAVLYFALTAEQSLELDPYNQFVSYLLQQNDNLRVFSVTLPFHSNDMRENEQAFTKWASLYEEGGDVVAFFVRKVADTLDMLVRQGIVHPDAVFVAGLSRGGLLASHLAIRYPQIRAVLGFAPVTVLSELPEFRDDAIASLSAKEKIARASLLTDKCVDALAQVPVRFYMGNFDTRVGTRNAFELTHALAERAVLAKGVRSPPHEFIMYCRYVSKSSASQTEPQFGRSSRSDNDAISICMLLPENPCSEYAFVMCP